MSLVFTKGFLLLETRVLFTCVSRRFSLSGIRISVQIDDTRKSIKNIVKIWTSGIENRDALTDSRQREAFRNINYWEI
jgi:hypothetical protein